MSVPSIPTANLNDGDQFLDRYGAIWEYDANANTFINRGQTKVYPDVTEEVDGFVSPPLFRYLTLLQTLIKNGYDFSHFKIKTSAGLPYFYYLRSSNDLIRYIPESQQRLRIEVDRGRLYQKLVGVCCVGPKGRTGPTGARGRPGKPAADETWYRPLRQGKRLVVNVEDIETPIDTAVSVRFYDSVNTQVAEFLFAVDGTDVSNTSDFPIISEDLSFADGHLQGSIEFDANTIGWRYKVRQRGKKGINGSDGLGFLEVVPQLLDDPSLICTQAVMSMRKSGDSNIRTLTRTLPSNICVSSLASFTSEIPEIDLINIKLVSVEVTTRECKNICFYDGSVAIPQTEAKKEAKVIIKTPELELPAWTPAPGCGQRNRWGSFKFNWWDYTNVDASFRVIATPQPPEQCCESDFFMCSNIGDSDSPCGVTGTDKNKAPNILMPEKFPGDCACECENPIGNHLSMGAYVFETFDLTVKNLTNEKFINAAVDSVVDGSNDIFQINVKFDSISSVFIHIVPNPDLCGGPKERESCAYRDKLDVKSNAEIIDMSGSTRIISSPSVDVENIPSVIEFSFEPLSANTESTVRITLSVNTTGLNYCRGYKVLVVANQVIS